ncbi:hypothetical protein RCL1_004123 [Eukaryota sp. TZLM3-RCL]
MNKIAPEHQCSCKDILGLTAAPCNQGNFCSSFPALTIEIPRDEGLPKVTRSAPPSPKIILANRGNSITTTKSNPDLLPQKLDLSRSQTTEKPPLFSLKQLVEARKQQLSDNIASLNEDFAYRLVRIRSTELQITEDFKNANRIDGLSDKHFMQRHTSIREQAMNLPSKRAIFERKASPSPPPLEVNKNRNWNSNLLR